MRPITVNVSESTYQEFKDYARRQDRKTAELIREAMELYREKKIQNTGVSSLRELRPESLGEVLQPMNSEDDLLDEMIHF
ncbi:MAG TPA: hypothetical protein DCX06_03085 [Opitutae bacterium]|nr:hypothetical protein [Opitutae bacterium]